MLYTVYASTKESVLEAGNKTEDTLLSSQRKKPDLHGFADDHAIKCTFKASDKQRHRQYQILNLMHQILSIGWTVTY